MGLFDKLNDMARRKSDPMSAFSQPYNQVYNQGYPQQMPPQGYPQQTGRPRNRTFEEDEFPFSPS